MNGPAVKIIGERLAVAIDQDETRHAMYPTASRTLCGIGDDQVVDVEAGAASGPDCLVCATAAALFDVIDRSAPPGWFREAEAA